MLNLNKVTLTIEDITVNNKALKKIIFSNKNMSVEVINLGCTITAINMADAKGDKKNIVAGFRDLKDYFNNPDYYGCVVGRVANRIANGKFTLKGQDYQVSQNANGGHLHGGFEGFHKKIWEITEQKNNENSCAVTFKYISKDGEEGYPGNLTVYTTYELNDNNQFVISFKATTDKATIINLTNHSYFNLSGFEVPEIYEHELTLLSKTYTEKGDNNSPNGKILNIENTAYDFSKPKKINKDIAQFISNDRDRGYDFNYVIDAHNSTVAVAHVQDPYSGRSMKVYTDTPGIQLYTSNFWDGKTIGSQNKAYVKHGAIALETQAFPDSINYPHFPNTILEIGEVFNSKTIFEFIS